MMLSNKFHLKLKSVVKIPIEPQEHDNDYVSDLQKETMIGGFLRNGNFTWRSEGTNLDVFCTTTGDRKLSYNFEYDIKAQNSTVIDVQEMGVNVTTSCIIAVGIRLENNMSMIVVLTLQGSRVLGYIDVDDHLSCLQPISRATHRRGPLSQYDGCIAVGTVTGKVLLVDVCLKPESDPVFGQRLVMNNLCKSQCHVEFVTEDQTQISYKHRLIRQRSVYFGLQLQSIEEENSSVTTILDLPSLMALAVGHADGRIVLYNLLDLSIMHVIQFSNKGSPVVKMCMVEPTDDPKACVYIWAFHAGEDGAFAVMHTLMYEEKYAELSGHVYEHFLSCSPRLNITCYDKDSYPLDVQSIMKTVSQEEEVLTLTVLSWIASDKSTNVLVFDLNQWYKAEMPFTCDWRHELKHTVVFNIKEIVTSVHLITDSLIPFNSIQRPEEHFYPNSLCFDLITLHYDSCPRYHWIGVQNKILDYLEQNGAVCLMEPNTVYNMLLRCALIPQFIEYNFSFDTPLDIQREFLLSVALEYNCYTLLNECAISWADGSHLGKAPEEGVSLSTLTDWMWSRAKVLKELSNTMCIPLFDLSGRRIDCGTQKTLLHCSRQLSQLVKLYELIFSQCKQYIPDKVLKCLASQKKSVQLAADYQEVVQWLLNVGLLPEGNVDGVNLSDEFLLVPFPYRAIRSYYTSQRIMFNDYYSDKESSANLEDQTCRYLFIDNFVEREFSSESLKKVWSENNASGVYPPNSMQNLLRALLISNVTIEIKYILLCYTFMDMTAVLGDGRYSGIVQNLIKFPSVFKLNSAIIKRTQAFWLLDHGNINAAIEELLSPMAQTERFPQWQREFLITALLRHDAPHLALRALRAPGTPISPFLELKTLLENNLISEAFKLQRSKHDTNLLCTFFEGTLKSAKYEVLLDLALSEEESRILREYLSRTNQPMSENVHFIHLLQKLDFVDAVYMIDKLGKKRTNEYNLEAPKETLALYHSALEPTTQHLSYLAYAEQKHLKPSKTVFAEPLSSRLIRGRADRGRIYHKSIVAIREAAEPLDHALPFLEKPGLGIFQLRTQTKSSNVCYPVNLEAKAMKRKHGEDNLPGSSVQPVGEVLLDFEKPAKRRKVETDKSYSASLIFPRTVLTDFRPVKASFNFSSRHSRGNTTEKSYSRSPSTQLSTPVVKKMFSSNPPSPESVSSYTPHGILKSTASVQSFLNQKSASLASVSVAPSSHANEAEEKILRFDIPESPQSRQNTQDFVGSFKTPTQDDSIISNDVFFSPEGSIVSIEDDTPDLNIKDILFGCPKARQSIHTHSRSNTPEENNIAIIIEDVEDDSASKQQENEIINDNNVNTEESILNKSAVSLSVSDNNPESGTLPLGQFLLESNKSTEASVLVKESSFQETDRQFGSVSGDAGVPGIANDYYSAEHFEENCHIEVIEGNVSLPSNRAEVDLHEAPTVIDDNDTVTDTTELELQTRSRKSTSHEKYVEEPAGILLSNDVTDDNSETSVHADVINISSSSSADDGDDDEEMLKANQEQDVENSINDDYFKDDSKPIEQSSSKNTDVVAGEIMEYEKKGRVDSNIDLNINISDLYSDRVPDIILNSKDNKEIHTDELNEAQVSTTTSTNSNMGSTDEPANIAVHKDEDNTEVIRHPEAEDLTVQQEAALQREARSSTPELSGNRTRNSTASVNDRSDSSVNAEIIIVSTSRDETFSLKKDDKYLGQPKKAHEVEIPAMNLSVKPDEAHEANRKNSKSDESDDAAALNLSTGQIIDVIPTDEQVSEAENSGIFDIGRRDSTSKGNISVKSRTECKENKGSTSEASSDAISQQDTKLFDDVSEIIKTPRRSRRISTDIAEATTSTPRSNVRTRRMSTIEKIEYGTTPTKRRTRASSVTAETASPSTSFKRNKKHASMTNITTPENVVLTPRRSMRAKSLAKEIIFSTPLTKNRCISESKIEAPSTENVNLSMEEVDIKSVDEDTSEKSFVSSASRRSSQRNSAISKQTLQPSTSKDAAEACLMKPSTSTSSKVDEQSFVEYSTNRRLTRHQSAIMEKSLLIHKMCTIPEDIDNPISHESNESESESVVSILSNVSKRSTRSKLSQQSRSKSQHDRTTRKKAVHSTRLSSSKRDNSDVESCDTDQSESPAKKPALETISEEVDKTALKTRRRGRTRKN
ncbi:protein ELYS [Sabethes cyaneus]|uniref:protein ELYS n=1 Tax=Sabethes cyaneus TaxID=53552 RepID=UPI00237D6BD6|nr:protein ELYS [Sabethes cyaneus]